LRAKEKPVRESLKGSLEPWQRLLLRTYWRQYQFLTSPPQVSVDMSDAAFFPLACAFMRARTQLGPTGAMRRVRKNPHIQPHLGDHRPGYQPVYAGHRI
jgi:hypothetical protein